MFVPGSKCSSAYGQGTGTYLNGDRYVGEWKGGKQNGRGTYYFANGSKYVGEWRNSKENGVGIYTYFNGDVYVGEWKDNQKNGNGTLLSSLLIAGTAHAADTLPKAVLGKWAPEPAASEDGLVHWG